MRVVHHPDHRGHDPRFFLVRGKPATRSAEQPQRADLLLDAVRGMGLEPLLPPDYGAATRAAVHDARYLAFLESAWRRWHALPDAGDEVVANVHPAGPVVAYPEAIVAQAGLHMADTACPIGEHTWRAACAAANAATHAAQLVIDGERAAYALCRPPGHHAYADRAGGFCYLNNSAIAAQHLRRCHERVAVVDVDVHHGNGTQGIFWRRRDVLTVSLHADPSQYYPFFAGYEQERGEGDGEGFNLNVPLPVGTDDARYLDALEPALARVRGFAPGALVVALGLDAYAGDPLKGMAITTAGFGRIGAALGRLGLPTVLVQEGGYLAPELGENLAAALRGFMGAA
ncbi:MAG: histone deacetylase family protein [Alphaproteobacteria bacterium]|nr:histone deacetylase family protein [Alphaproteobacteria bacterium]